MLSAILTATTLFPRVDVTLLAEVLFAVLAVGLAAAGIYTGIGRRRNGAEETERIPREDWTMPQLELLERPAWSRTRTARGGHADRQGDRGQRRPMNALTWSDFVLRLGARCLPVR